MSIDYYALTLEEIESHFNIKPIQQWHKDQLQLRHVTLDEWEELETFLYDLRVKSQDPSFNISVIGYEIYKEDYIRLYYTYSPSFA